MRRIFGGYGYLAVAVAGALAFGIAPPASARFGEDTPEYQDLKAFEQALQVNPYAGLGIKGRGAPPAALPDIDGPGAVLNVGNVWMKVTNNGYIGNPFTNRSSDPSGQWPGASSIEYLNAIGLAVGAVNPLATDPTAIRRVSYFTEWRPPTLDSIDRMYRAYDGVINGTRFVNDDSDVDPSTGDARIDEDFLDGRDNDGDGRVDEDFAAIGQQMWTCQMSDNTPQAINAAATERHVPLGLEVDQSAWAYSIPGFTDFNVMQWDVYNRSGHELDSLAIGWIVDMDCGPVDKSNYYADDFMANRYPYGDFVIKTQTTDLRIQAASDHDHVSDVADDQPLCPAYKVRVQGFSVADDDGDDGRTGGIGSFFLIDHTIDPTGKNGPRRVGFTAFRSIAGSTPYAQGGNPRLDQQRYEFMTGNAPGDTRGPVVGNIDTEAGWIAQDNGDNKGDYYAWCSVGPWAKVANGEHVSVVVGFGVTPGKYRQIAADAYQKDYNRFTNRALNAVSGDSIETLRSKYPGLDNALSAQIAYEGSYEVRAWPVLPDYYGREYCVKAPPGQFLTLQGCPDRDPSARIVRDNKYECFDMDCDYCTGAFSKSRGGLFHHTWLAEAPPPSPNTNLGVSYNYTDNPYRRVVAAGDHQVSLAWDNLSETTPDPKTGEFDFRGYRIWKVSNWRRPVGSGGPSEDDWTLLAEFRLFDAHPTNAYTCPPESILAGVCAPGDSLVPYIFVPQTGETKRLLLRMGDLWDPQSGAVIRPDSMVVCTGYPVCETSDGFQLGAAVPTPTQRDKYPIGRYRFVDRQVKNGFLYFYSVTAFDSTGSADKISQLSSRRAAVEAEGVVPQSGTDFVARGSGVWVVPNPYRGARQINNRPSAWDLTPNATDPTGTHVDFMGLPPGHWKIKIFTVSGDLVETLDAFDAVNASIRGTTSDSTGTTRPGVNRQQDNPNDGQARWNLISRNGQDVVSGIYLFTVEVGGEVKHRGKFVIIR